MDSWFGLEAAVVMYSGTVMAIVMELVNPWNPAYRLVLLDFVMPFLDFVMVPMRLLNLGRRLELLEFAMVLRILSIHSCLRAALHFHTGMELMIPVSHSCIRLVADEGQYCWHRMVHHRI